MPNETIITSTRYLISQLKLLADCLERRNAGLYECSDICSNKKLKEYWKLINDAVIKADEAYRMGLREDN